MAQDHQAFLKRLLATFRIEAAEHLQAMRDLAAGLRTVAPAEQGTEIEILFREAHSLKGAARAVGLREVEVACAALENALAPLKRGEVALTRAMLAGVERDISALNALLDGHLTAEVAAVSPRAADPAPSAVPSAAPSVPVATTVRLGTDRLAAMLVHADALQAFRFAADAFVAELSAIASELGRWRKVHGRRLKETGALRRPIEGSGERPGTGGAQGAMARLYSAMDADELEIRALHDRVTQLARRARDENRSLRSIGGGLQAELLQALMQPVDTLFEIVPKVVQDLARELGKEVVLKLDGAGVEIDRRILEQLKDPLLHLVRNAVDHGLETPDVRARAGKPRQGVLRVAARSLEGNQVEIEIADDGRGFDFERIEAEAVRLGLLPPGERPRVEPERLAAMVFESGLTTSPIVTDLSGHGLGLAIVREKVEGLGGRVRNVSARAGGACFQLCVPTALVTFHGVVVAVGERRFVLPATHVRRIARIESSAVRTVENREVTEVGDGIVALAGLAPLLGIPGAVVGQTPRQLHVVLLEHGGVLMGLAVDAVLGDREVLVKGLGPQLKRVRHIAGATVLDAGAAVPILSVADLFQSARERPAPVIGARPEPADEPAAARQQAILIAEDSITSRTLLKSILESAGYAVTAAVDGVDALTALRAGAFDLLVSDVEMPRMDGFELTSRVRQDPRLKALPVVLVTALGSREHRERGIDAGANAYIVKSSFDQSNLLEVIGRFI